MHGSGASAARYSPDARTLRALNPMAAAASDSPKSDVPSRVTQLLSRKYRREQRRPW